jgi:hypothetical protein
MLKKKECEHIEEKQIGWQYQLRKSWNPHPLMSHGHNVFIGDQKTKKINGSFSKGMKHTLSKAHIFKKEQKKNIL